MRTTTTRRLFAAGALLLAAACGSSDDSATPDNGAKTYDVKVDANSADLEVTQFTLAYYPKALSVHPGDTVRFGLNDSGEPHTVALGSLVDDVLTDFKALSPAQKEDPPKALTAKFEKIPELLPEGPGDAIQAGAQPCFQATGLPSTKDACAVKTGEFTGAEALVSSGWLDANAPFTLKISDSAKAGTYEFFCQLHGPDMGGTLTVVDKAAKIPAPEEVTTTGKEQLEADTAKLDPARAQLAKGTADHVRAGTASKDFEQGMVAAFGPKDVQIPVGGTVGWDIVGPHSIFFNAPADAQQLRSTTPDGAVHLNAKAVTPLGGPGQSDKPGPILGGTWAGVSPHSSGLVFGDPGEPAVYRLTFSKAGTYDYICSIHENMKGTVTVG